MTARRASPDGPGSGKQDGGLWRRWRPQLRDPGPLSSSRQQVPACREFVGQQADDDGRLTFLDAGDAGLLGMR